MIRNDINGAVASPPGVSPSQALNDNTRFRVVWQILNALRAIELTLALKRSSWARRALRICQTTRKRVLSLSAWDGETPGGMATGRMI